MRNVYLTILLIFIGFSFSCKRSLSAEADKEKDRAEQSCGNAVVANASNFSTISSDYFTINDASISGDCLTVRLGLARACTDPASFSVLHAPTDAAVYPPLHALKIALTYGTGCAMPGSKSYRFDLYPIRQKNTNKISISISGYQG